MSKKQINNSKKYSEVESSIQKQLEQLGVKEKIDSSELLQLKNVLKDINNLLTYKLTISAAKWLIEEFNLQNYSEKIFEDINLTSINSNGFDIRIEFDKVKILGEIKCNVPINGGDLFGSNQAQGIINDIKKLNAANKKSKDISVNEYYKFLFLADENNVKKAVQNTNFKSRLNKYGATLEYSSAARTKDMVYVIYLAV